MDPIPHSLAAEPEPGDASLAGLLAQPRRLPPHLPYDHLGSALFEAITRLPEYYLARAERALLGAHADEIAERSGRPRAVVELGPGTGDETRLVLQALGATTRELDCCHVDVSADAFDALCERRGWSPRLVLLLGARLGHHAPREAVRLLSSLARALSPGDHLLVGADLRKDPRLLLPAYDDPLGLTAAFNRNLLARLNRERGCDFDVAGFSHEATWEDEESCVTLALRAQRRQRVRVPPLGRTLTFDVGERVLTERCYKLSLAHQLSLFGEAGFAPVAHFVAAPERYALHLCLVEAEATRH